MHAHKVNLIALTGSAAVAVAAIVASGLIEPHARAGGGWHRLYLVAPALGVLLTCASLAALACCLRRRVSAEPMLVTAIVLLVTWLQVDAGVARFKRYSSSRPPAVEAAENPPLQRAGGAGG